MKIKFILILILVLQSTINFSQFSSLIKNKLAIVYDLTYNPKSYIDENEGIIANGIIETIKRTNFEHSLTFNYKILNRLSLSLISGIHTNKITHNFDYFHEGIDHYSKINSFSYGVGVNLFFKKGLAPSDSHLGIYYKQHRYQIKESEVVNALYGNKYNDDGLIYNMNAIGDMKINLALIGIKYVYTRMFTKTLPVYWNIGINYTIPIKINRTYSKIEFDHKDSYHYYPPETTDDQFLLLDYYKLLHRYRINLGIGYLF